MTMEHITSNNLLFLFVLYKLETYGILTTCRKRKEIISKSSKSKEKSKEKNPSFFLSSFTKSKLYIWGR